MQKADMDVKKYASNLGFLGIDLEILAEGGRAKDIPRMVHALECERLRLLKLDPSIGSINVPGPPTREKECAVN
jgi:hypothetical protein